MDEPLTPIEESVARTGRRFWKMRKTDYTAFGANLNATRGFPAGVGSRAPTLRALHPVETMPVATDGSGHVLVNLKASWVGTSLPLESSPHVTQLTDTEYAAIMPIQEGL